MTSFMIVSALWCSFYTASLSRALWRSQNRRGAIIVAVLALFVLVIPLGVQWYLLSQ